MGESAAGNLPIYLLVEGNLDRLVAQCLLKEVGLEYGTTYPRGGWNALEKKFTSFNKTAQGMPVLALLDFMEPKSLYNAPCPGDLVEKLVPLRHPNFLLRIVVREIESWLLADRERLSDFLSIQPNHIPSAPELENDPKQTLVKLASTSRRKEIRTDLVPQKGTSASQGPGYNSRMAEFVINQWRPREAAKRAPSLSRCLTALRRWKLES
ncbi:MAG: hypothetical protein AAGD01_07615 [Acidobacteriota bacterium]